jgi:hypothetical protein
VGVQFFIVRLVTLRDMLRVLLHGLPGGNGGDAALFGHLPMLTAVIMALYGQWPGGSRHADQPGAAI